MLHGPVRLSLLAAFIAFGATGVTLAFMGIGLPYAAAALLPALAGGILMYAALRLQPKPDRSVELALRQQLEDFRTHAAAMRHDLRGVLSPALMMSDRLVNHAEPVVQRAGNAVVKSIERATSLLSEDRTFMAKPPPP